MINIIFQLEEEFDVPLWTERVLSQRTECEGAARVRVCPMSWGNLELAG